MNRIETRQRMRAARLGFKWSDDVKSKMSKSASPAQKKRRAKEMSTKAGKAKVLAHMTMMRQVGYGTEEYRESKRRACLIGWEKRRAKQQAEQQANV